MDQDQLITKAIKLFSQKSNIQPSANDSTIENEGGKDYVVLRNVNGVIAVYLITGEDYLKQLKDIPGWVSKK